ncbi:hypothetical protein UA08_05996 [Talaromyces atroroseus]|uniref:Uncharacterized protein n=1 Tax=Talaromyces atroroseus TaxID=1441469 RepID=A0A225ABZ0_TALAT|nr:hypothetical protein UA08_05996 [Talaromyces atroroseus]OKL58621.1 hypothetical protein UA08_05996 [Talaromyces atroroseus]
MAAVPKALVFSWNSTRISAGYEWEFDRVHSVFVTVNLAGRMIELDPRRPYRSLLPSIVHLHEVDTVWDEESEDVGLAERLNLSDETLSGRPLPERTSEEILEELFASSKYRRDVYISACIRRDINELRQLFETYSEDDFVSQLSDKGDSGVLLAVTEENGLANGLATVKWLHERGAAITHSNHYGRTPLMEAALWGRFEIVQYLTAQGVAVQARDGNGMNALELAMDCERNAGERASRAGLNYQEPAYADNQRARIESHLRRLSKVPSRSPGAEDPSRRGLSFFQRTADGNLALYRPKTILLVPGGHPYKAFAELDRGPNYPLVTAMSGYTYPAWPNVLDNSLWANRADELRRYRGLSPNIRAASHVEPQLPTYLLFHHDLIKFTDEDGDFEQGDLQSLLNDLLPLNPAPIITVNKGCFCTSCEGFYSAFRRTFHRLNVQFRFQGAGNANRPV